MSEGTFSDVAYNFIQCDINEYSHTVLRYQGNIFNIRISF